MPNSPHCKFKEGVRNTNESGALAMCVLLPLLKIGIRQGGRKGETEAKPVVEVAVGRKWADRPASRDSAGSRRPLRKSPRKHRRAPSPESRPGRARCKGRPRIRSFEWAFRLARRVRLRDSARRRARRTARRGRARVSERKAQEDFGVHCVTVDEQLGRRTRARVRIRRRRRHKFAPRGERSRCPRGRPDDRCLRSRSRTYTDRRCRHTA